jgi:hypothetical protein
MNRICFPNILACTALFVTVLAVNSIAERPWSEWYPQMLETSAGKKSGIEMRFQSGGYNKDAKKYDWSFQIKNTTDAEFNFTVHIDDGVRDEKVKHELKPGAIWNYWGLYAGADDFRKLKIAFKNAELKPGGAAGNTITFPGQYTERVVVRGIPSVSVRRSNSSSSGNYKWEFQNDSATAIRVGYIYQVGGGQGNISDKILLKPGKTLISIPAERITVSPE